MNQSQKIMFTRCCYGYAVSGIAVLVIGAVLPSVMREASLNYTLAGGMLSMMAIGNLLASFVFPMLVKAWGMRLSITVTSFLVPLSYLLLARLPGPATLFLLMLAAGIGRGSVTIINNTAVNIISGNSAKALNLLHCCFAIGAFVAPFVTAVLLGAGFGWRSAIYLTIALTFSSALSYALMDYQEIEAGKLPEKSRQTADPADGGTAKDRAFLKNVNFYCIGILLFFYLGTENCINGWFVTYLQNTGVMSEAYATSMVSVTWLTIMAGRLVCASLSQKVGKSTITLANTIGGCICFAILLLSSHLVTVTAALVGLGFFLSGIYPTCIADAGQYTKGSTLGMSLLTAISALGGIVTPQLIGTVADRIGIVAAFGLLCTNAVMMVILAGINFLRSHKR